MMQLVECVQDWEPTEYATMAVPFWKRALDIAVIVFLLPALIPVMVFMALMIKVLSPGPVFFRQQRVGHLGKSFTILKFRTMKVNADTGVHQQHLAQLMKTGAPMTKLDMGKDSRLIPFGAAIRSTGLDELPQLINVLKGDMSVVGPRPCVQYEFDQYAPWQKERVDTLPGLTGLWQVSGKNRTTFTEMINLDIHYSRHKSPWLDLWIIGRTFPALVEQAREVMDKGTPPKTTPTQSASAVS